LKPQNDGNVSKIQTSSLRLHDSNERITSLNAIYHGYMAPPPNNVALLLSPFLFSRKTNIGWRKQSDAGMGE